MIRRHPTAISAGVLVLSVIIVVSGRPAGQTSSAAGDKKHGSVPPRTSWGEPDLRGTWWSDSLTPLERPNEFGQA